MSASNAETATGQLNLLVSYPYIDTWIIGAVRDLGPRVRFVVDSGAFTAWCSGNPIALDDYCRFIEQLPVRPWRYFVLDKIGDPDGTRENYETMRKRGLHPVPIFTRGESREQLDAYYATSDLVGFGGLVGTRAANRLVYVHTMLKHNEGRRAHLLGFTVFSHLKALRPYMVDSSAWEAARRYGMADVYMGYGQFKRLTKADARTAPPEALMQRVRALGFGAAELATYANWHGGNSLTHRISAASWIAASLDAERNLGTKLFLSCATQSAVQTLVRQYERMQA